MGEQYSSIDENTKARHNSKEVSLLTVQDVKELLHISQSTIYRLINNKLLPAVKIQNRTLFRVSDIETYINSLNNYEGGANGF